MSTDMPLDCDGFAAQLADYLDGDAPDAVRAAVESHAAECAACRQLLDDLSALRHDAAALPDLVPSRDLWEGIAERIDAKVVPIGAPARIALPAQRRWMRPSLAAAALVIVTAGVTHLATRISIEPAATRSTQVAARQDDTAASAEVVAQAPDVGATDTTAAPSPVRVASANAERGTGSAAAARRRSTGSAQGTAPTAARLASASTLMSDTDPVYDREIVALRQMLQTRRSQLDPNTIAVLEQSVAVIDSAIAQSRAALAKDPASGFLATQLNHSLGKKVQLLRTAALLPART